MKYRDFRWFDSRMAEWAGCDSIADGTMLSLAARRRHACSGNSKGFVPGNASTCRSRRIVVAAI